MGTLLTLAEMAAHLSISAKTLKKHILAKQIPHYQIGRSMRLDPVVVMPYFQHTEPPRNVVEFRPVKHQKSKTKSRFAQMVGL